MEKQNIYQDISARTGGEIYLGVVGWPKRKINFY